MSKMNCGFADSPLALSALVLRGEQGTKEDDNLARLLDFFAIPWKTVAADDTVVSENQRQYAILSSADCLAGAVVSAQGSGESLPAWIAKASAVYVYGFQDDERSFSLLRLLTGDSRAELRPLRASQTTMTVTESLPEMCGPMSGLQVPVTVGAPGLVCEVEPVGRAFQSVIRCEDGELFFEVSYAGVRFYVNAWSRTLDIDVLSPEYFDVKKFFCEAVPPTLYLKWAFRDTAVSRSETSACLIVDDPPLKRRYGFLDFRTALDLMDRHNFTTTIAFIPWNWSRSDPHTVSMFQNRPERLSVVVHGCDHTSAEFAERSPLLLNRKIQTSRQRMACFRQQTSIKAASVMVFPQGVFSPESGRALKLNGFVAAVNTEVAPVQKSANKTTIADLWSIAIMKYGTFPIVTRRYPGHGIENFAFDALLGKPCLIAAHHDVFRNHGQNLVEFVLRLKSLRWNLVWRPLREIVQRNYTISRLSDGTLAINMFAGSVIVENPSAESQTMLLLKKETDPEKLQAVSVNNANVEFSVDGGCLRAKLTIPPGDAASVRVAYHEYLEATPDRGSSSAKFQVAIMRYLSEFRDNYLSRSDFLFQSAYRLKRLIR